jgi:hypothetical protein
MYRKGPLSLRRRKRKRWLTFYRRGLHRKGKKASARQVVSATKSRMEIGVPGRILDKCVIGGIIDYLDQAKKQNTDRRDPRFVQDAGGDVSGD